MTSPQNDLQTVCLLERIRNYAMPDGALGCRGTWLRQEGEMRFAPGRPWMPFRAEQWFPGNGIEFSWKARVRMSSLVRASIVDSFRSGRGMLTARLFGLIPLIRSRGPATDRGEALRGLAELPWRPFIFGQPPPFLWQSIGNGRLRVIFDDANTRAAIIFEINPEGMVCSALASSRPRMIGGAVEETDWSGFFDDYRTFRGVRVPTTAEAIWALPEGPFTYWRGRVKDFRILR